MLLTVNNPSFLPIPSRMESQGQGKKIFSGEVHRPILSSMPLGKLTKARTLSLQSKVADSWIYDHQGSTIKIGLKPSNLSYPWDAHPSYSGLTVTHQNYTGPPPCIKKYGRNIM